MHDGEIAHLFLERQVAQPLLVLFCQFIARPFDGALGQLVKVGRESRDRRLLVVVAFYGGAIQFANTFQTLIWIRVVPDHVAQTNKMRALALVRIGKDSFERLQVGVDVTENCETHCAGG